MKIDFCSDLHVDAWYGTTQLHDPTAKRWMGEPFKSTFVYLDWAKYRNPESRVLVIAGDIANTLMTTKDVIKVAAADYEHVVVVEGNHDHYDNDMSVEDGMDLLETMLGAWPNVHYLRGDNQFTLDGVTFIGSTAWYDWKAYENQGISDFLAKRAWNQWSNDSRYPYFDCKSPDSMAMTQAVNMTAQVDIATNDPNVRSIVMVTHMSPRGDIMEWKSGDSVWNALTPSYVNTGLKACLDADVNKKIGYWIYGHTHTRQMVDIDGVVYANNARGYPRENPPFSLTQIEV